MNTRIHVKQPIACACLTLALALPGIVKSETRRATPERIQSAIQSGLRSMLARQNADGSFVCEKYPVAVTGLATLALLANRGDPPEPAYEAAIETSVAYLLGAQRDDGMSGENLYEHAIGALAVLHRFGMGTDDDAETRLADYARRAVALTLEAANVPKSARARGGWAYTPNQDAADLSNTAWQIMVLFSAKQCGFAIPSETLDAALDYVNRCRQRDGFGYTPPFTAASARSHRSLTGAAIFVREILDPGSMQRDPEIVRWMTDIPASWGGSQYRGYFFSAGFYMTQGVFQVGGRLWTDYFDQLAAILLENQASDGSWPFPPDNLEESRKAGPVYATAMAILMLSLENQHLPLYQRQAAMHFIED